MDSRPEELASRSLRSLLAAIPDGAGIDESDEFGDLQSALERFLPSVLQDVYPREWKGESLDGFNFGVARKTGPDEAELLGLCILISDQTWTPVHVRLRAETGTDSIACVHCKLGTRDDNGIMRLPAGSAKMSKLLFAVTEQPESLDWVYVAERHGNNPAG